MSVVTYVKVIEVTGGPEDQTTSITAAIAALSPAPVAGSDVHVIPGQGGPRLKIYITWRSG